ncbi:5'-methylthioadenosine phosphorylase [Microbacterium mangrovi]|uniref:S-methyl-5'-thioadenosine phosphorylase n=1 Tax=Microbacterium mangrovi TaxID=1348253 RepID=A0A0B2A5D7_9MICO|nr:S-methyl-5'-thioinosine phosphorylase [Microbacterium mangrovi]KHK98285.1 5'-methylthioadenosine phosphorylase [Microbacterium mangrovi]
MHAQQPIDIAVIGGSGMYELIDEPEIRVVSTPYGAPSAGIAVGRFAGRTVAFLARHGSGHSLSPRRVPYRANVWALASLGVRAVIATAAVGSLHPQLPPGQFVVPDQLLDRTGRIDDTFFEDVPQHLPFADPFCPAIRAALADGLSASGEAMTTVATTAVIRGPRFSTRAESRALRAEGADVVNMTQYPEAALAAELGLGYASLAFVTDADAGPGSGSPVVTAETVLQRLSEARPRIVAVLDAAIRALPRDYAPRTLVPPEVVRTLLAGSPA